MQLIPAIDLYQNQCVRLHQGSYDKITVYSDNPLLIAKEYVASGADQLHVVDLQGARDGCFSQTKIIQKIKQSTSLIIQAGGGIRTIAQAENLLKNNLDRVVLGSIVVKKLNSVKTLIKQYGAQKIVLALDVYLKEQPFLAIHGWQATTQISLWELLIEFSEYQGLNILCTDIMRDGTLSGPNLDLYQQCLEKFNQFNWQASGGISEIADLIKLQQIGVKATIIGKALYENRFSFSQALQEIQSC